MEKLTIKELAPYLPYGLKYYPSEKSDLFHDLYADKFPHTTRNYSLALLEKDKDAIDISNSFLKQKTPFITFEDNELFLGQFESSLGFDVDDVFVSEVKPILRPLSDLTEKHIKEIYSQSPNTPNWSEFYKEWINEKCDLSETIIEYAVVEMLLEWHFDIFGLIEKGLAIDINKLNEGI